MSDAKLRKKRTNVYKFDDDRRNGRLSHKDFKTVS